MPERVTEFDYDDAGKLVRSREYVESAWDEYQQGLMLALAEWEDMLCPLCGGPPEVCQDLDAAMDNPYGKWVYWPVKQAECHVTTAARSRKPQDGDNDKGLIPRVQRVPRGSPRPPLN